MNYYRRYMGDYAADTGHLTALQHGFYALLLDWQYAKEQELPESVEQVRNIAKAITKKQHLDLQAVLDEFFPGGWNPRAQLEISKAGDAISQKSAAGSSSASKRWGQKKNSDTRSQRLAAARAKATHTKDEWMALVHFCGDVCLKCGAENVQKDHILPIYLGGSDGIENLQPLCRSCNSAKSAESTDYRADGWREWVTKATETPNGTPNECVTTRAHPSSTLHPPVSKTPPSEAELPSVDPKKLLWDTGVALFGNDGRKFIGRLISQYTEQRVCEAIAMTAGKNPADPKSWIIGVLKNGSKQQPTRPLSAVDRIKQANGLDVVTIDGEGRRC